MQCYDRWTKFFDQPDKNDLTKHSRNCNWSRELLFICSSLFQEHYTLIVVDLRKQQALDAKLKAIQQISFTAR